MNKVGLSVLLAVNLIESSEGMRLSEKSLAKASGNQALTNVKEGEVVFNQNVEMTCVAGK